MTYPSNQPIRKNLKGMTLEQIVDLADLACEAVSSHGTENGPQWMTELIRVKGEYMREANPCPRGPMNLPSLNGRGTQMLMEERNNHG